MSLYNVMLPFVDGTKVVFRKVSQTQNLFKAESRAAEKHGYVVEVDGANNRQVTPNYFYGSELEAQIETQRKLESARVSYPEWMAKQCFVNASWA